MRTYRDSGNYRSTRTDYRGNSRGPTFTPRNPIEPPAPQANKRIYRDNGAYRSSQFNYRGNSLNPIFKLEESNLPGGRKGSRILST